MPRYDYACDECDHRFEAVHPITSDALSVCPECGGTLRRVIGAVGVSFKGSGFYRTDSRAASRRSKAPSASPGSASSPAAPSGTGGDAAPAATPTSKPATPAAAKTPAAAPPRASGSDS